MSQLGPLVFVLALSAANASCSVEPANLTLRIGMTVTELNAQPAIADRFKRLDSDWIAHGGPLNLHLLVRGGSIEVPVSGSNGGVQLSTWRGPKADYAQPRLNTAVAVVEPQGLNWDDAMLIAERLCTQAREAGLAIDYGPTEPHKDRNQTNGVAACTIRDNTQAFDARVVPLGMPPSGKYRVEVSVQAYFEV